MIELLDRSLPYLPGRLHKPIRKGISRAIHFKGRYTARYRILPSYLVIGSLKCGTTSLYKYLIDHPGIAYTAIKEVEFFDRHFEKGVDWYRRHFPTVFSKQYHKLVHQVDLIAGEASPRYISCPYAARRVASLLPDVKLIALLRNPVDRAYSHYRDTLRMGFEPLSFEEALAQEEDRLRDELEHIRRDEHYYSLPYRRHAYLASGHYADHLQPWLEAFPRDQMLVVNSEDLFTDTAAVFRRVTAFLGVSDWEPRAFQNVNPGRYPPMKPETRAYLADYFAPHNQRLYDCLGVNFNWA